MDIAFRTNRLQKAYDDDAVAIRRWGPEVGKRYIDRVDRIYAMPNFDGVQAIHAWNTHELTGNYAGLWAISLTGQWRLIVIPSEDGESLSVEEVTNHYGD